MKRLVIRSVIVAMVLVALGLGALLYYLQEYGYYTEVSAPAEITIVNAATGLPEAIAFSNFQGIDSDTSPIRYRACFDTELAGADLSVYTAYAAEPLVAPGWFDCFDAKALGAAMEAGELKVMLSQEEISYGIDRVVAIMPDGRGYIWNKINECGEVVFSGDAVPEGCPPLPERLN